MNITKLIKFAKDVDPSSQNIIPYFKFPQSTNNERRKNMKRFITLLTVLFTLAIFVMTAHAKAPTSTVVPVETPDEAPVQVMNGYTNPVPVEVLNQSSCAKIPAQYDDQAVSINSLSEEVSFTMPIGRDIDYVVIEQVTLHSFVDNSNNVTNVYIESTLGGKTVKHYLTYQELCHDCIVPSNVPIGNQNIYNASQQIRVYADPGSIVSVKVYLDGVSSGILLQASITGYEVSMGCSE